MMPKLLPFAFFYALRQVKAVNSLSDISLSKFGFDHSWSATKGWFFAPPRMDDGELATDNVNDIESCAEICSLDVSFVGGEFDADNSQCFCYTRLICLEPCVALVDGPVEFATRPFSDFRTCAKSFCDYFAQDEDYDEICADTLIGYNQTACDAKISDSNVVISPFEVSLSEYGYNHSWSSAKGWFFYPPGASGEENFETKNVENVEACAEICSMIESMAGEYQLDGKQCRCYDNLVCLEPCVGLVDRAVEFSISPLSDFGNCDKSFCDIEFFGGSDNEYCSSLNWDQAACDAKMGTSDATTTSPSDISLSKYGFDHSWSSANGWFFYPPGIDKNDVRIENVNDVEACANICSNIDGMAGGEYQIDTRECYCFDNLFCLEPCVGLNGKAVEFSTLPFSDFDTCEKSFCESYYDDWVDFCNDPDNGWDPNACAAKIAASKPAISPFDTSLSEYGFDNSWSSTKGWFFPPQSMDVVTHTTTNVFDVESCAEICSQGELYSGGEFDIDKNVCTCYNDFICLEPCVGLTSDRAVEFSKFPQSHFSKCARSFCDYFYDTNQDYCDDPFTGWDPTTCAEKIDAFKPVTSPSDISLSDYGYDYSWSSANGWFFYPPGIDKNDKRIENVKDVQACADICSDIDGMAGGEYEIDTRECYCFDNLFCLEPCVGLNDKAVEFSTRPFSDFDTCEKSFCESYYDDWVDFCSDPENGWDPNACAAKIGTPELVTPPSDVSLSEYGYNYSWSSAKGWFFYPPGSAGRDDILTEDVNGVEACAKICSEMEGVVGGGIRD